MRHELWGPEIHNHRISDQDAPLVSFILKYDLIIWNYKDSKPTFEKSSWLDSELEVNRKKTRALRSRYQRCRREEERSMRRIVYKKQEAHYKWLIKQKCRASFELFCQQLVANNAFDLPYKIAEGKIRKQTVLQSVKTSNGQFTNTIEETIKTIVQALFPTDDSTQETHVQRKKRETVNTYSSTILDKQFTKQEITYEMKLLITMKKKKAPGIDGISIEIIKELHGMNPDILHYTCNKCLEFGIFPETWKEGKLIIFNKTGKGPSLPNAYRPICLLSALGKILDKLLVFRITHLLHKNNRLHKQQHAFRNGRSRETANFRLWQAINIALQERVPVTLLSLDVQGAFDTVRRTSIIF
ncbi:Retrovirus-related Pol polyprotein from type-1 retrotransposable element R1 [Araneus ventricosus]|uniref:Retrovirus-related Pol polyprotein from type-1 retrotransposable element R1 n=1 Tax=Araneus ventricosus TaxID=182803 RepID=A0A4Y2LT63_ARAVE|nr:Retrovirus-related Pol polyprotein from type-1 retrotransposable element R1 [Araneus ventricosus]